MSITDSELSHLDFNLSIVDSKLSIADSELSIADFELSMKDSELSIIHPESSIGDSELTIQDSGLQFPDFDLSIVLFERLYNLMVVSMVSSFNQKILKVQQGIFHTWKSLVSLLNKYNLIASQMIIKIAD